jgi:hypothetical protein
MLYDYIIKLQTDLELTEPLGREGQESYHLRLDDTVISIIDSPPGFELSATLGTLPTEKPEEFLSHMLRGNLFGQATHGAVLGLDETGANIVLQFNRPEKASYTEFKNAVEDFINTVLFWLSEMNNNPNLST